MKAVSSFVSSIMAGAFISIGGTVYLSMENKMVGAFLFAVGLFVVCNFGYNLFTGKVAYILENKPSYSLWCCSVWLGNLVGTLIVGNLLRLTRASIIETAQKVSETKLSDNLLSIFILAIFCNILIVVATESFKNNPNPVGKYLGLVFGIMVFILCGFEHCVANMFYFTVSGSWSLHTVGYLIIMTLGNTVGGVIIPLCRRLQNKAAASTAEAKVAVGTGSEKR
ncbi:MAG: formate/nitrite transporter family protein [Oscillospiraceae bacterium]|nr:formate/nitrite transporter family protein [Oscillospiraceae bacterium]